MLGRGVGKDRVLLHELVPEGCCCCCFNSPSNCRFISSQRKQGCVVETLGVSLSNQFSCSHSLEECARNPQVRLGCLRNRKSVLLDMMSRLASISSLRSITLSSQDPGHGQMMLVDLVFTKPLPPESRRYIDRILKAGEYSLLDANVISDGENTIELDPLRFTESGKFHVKLDMEETSQLFVSFSEDLPATGKKRLEAKLEPLPGIEAVDLARNSGYIRFTPELITEEDIMQHIAKLGLATDSFSIIPRSPSGVSTFFGDGRLTRTVMEIEGMTCSSCVNSIERVYLVKGGAYIMDRR